MQRLLSFSSAITIHSASVIFLGGIHQNDSWLNTTNGRASRWPPGGAGAPPEQRRSSASQVRQRSRIFRTSHTNDGGDVVQPGDDARLDDDVAERQQRHRSDVTGYGCDAFNEKYSR